MGRMTFRFLPDVYLRVPGKREPSSEFQLSDSWEFDGLQARRNKLYKFKYAWIKYVYCTIRG